MYDFRHVHQPDVTSNSSLCHALLLGPANESGLHQANVFRHALMEGIPTWAVEYVSFDESPPTKHDEWIAQRIGMCPIVQTAATDLTDVIGYLNVSADPRRRLTSVTMADFQYPPGQQVQFYQADRQEIVQLQAGQSLACQIRFTRNTDHAKYRPVAAPALRPVVQGFFTVSKSLELPRAKTPWVIQNIKFGSETEIPLKLQDKLAAILGALPIERPASLTQIRLPAGALNLHSLILGVPDREALDRDFLLTLPADMRVEFEFVVNNSEAPRWRPISDRKRNFTDADTGYYFSFYTVWMLELNEMLTLAVKNIDRVVNVPAPNMYNRLVID